MGFQAKGIAFYRQGNFGWSEVYWLSGGSFTSAQAQLDTINTARLALSTSNVACDGLIVYDLGDPPSRTSYLTAPTTPLGTFATGSAVSVDARDALVVKMTDAAFHNATKWIRAYPNTIETPPRTYTVVSAWETNFAAWVNAVKTAAQFRHKTGGGPPPVYAFSSITDVRNAQRFNPKKAGRPFGQQRGRR